MTESSGGGWDGRERRRWPRVPAERDLRFSLGAEAQPKHASRMDNISVGGLLFETDEEVPVGTLLRLEIHIPDYHRPRSGKAVLGPITTLGTVVRTEAAEGDRYRIGVCFVNMAERDREEVERFVRRSLEEE